MFPAGRFASLALLILMAASVAPSITHAADSSLPVALTLVPAASESEAPLAIRAGSPAPEFDIATTPYGWRRFSDFWKQDEIVLVFDPEESSLIAIEREARDLAGSGVSLTVVRQSSDGDNWSALQRLGLTCSLLSDPNGYIAELFGLAGGSPGSAGAWCLVDRGGVVRHVAAGVPAQALAADIGRHIRVARAMAGGGEAR